MNDNLPDMTPTFIDRSIRAFTSQLCCDVNPIAIVAGKRVCQACFDVLRANYQGPAWNIGDWIIWPQRSTNPTEQPDEYH